MFLNFFNLFNFFNFFIYFICIFLVCKFVFLFYAHATKLCSVISGSQSAKVVESGHQRSGMYGRGKAYSRHDCERLFRHLVVLGVLDEELVVTAHENTVCYVRLGAKAPDLQCGNLKVNAAKLRYVATIIFPKINVSM